MGEGLIVVGVQVSVRACTVGKPRPPRAELDWIPVRTVDDRVDEPDELTAAVLGALDDGAFRATR